MINGIKDKKNKADRLLGHRDILGIAVIVLIIILILMGTILKLKKDPEARKEKYRATMHPRKINPIPYEMEGYRSRDLLRGISPLLKLKSGRDPFARDIVREPESLDYYTGIFECEEEEGEHSRDTSSFRELKSEDVGIYITGIIKNKNGFRAILNGRNGKSYLVRPGRKFGGWEVASITRDQVIMKSGDFLVRLSPIPVPKLSGTLTNDKMTKRKTEFNLGEKNRLAFKPLRLTGVFSGESGLKAILIEADGKHHLVRHGQKVGDWTVSLISGRMVFLRKSDELAILELSQKPSPHIKRRDSHQVQI